MEMLDEEGIYTYTCVQNKDKNANILFTFMTSLYTFYI